MFWTYRGPFGKGSDARQLYPSAQITGRAKHDGLSICLDLSNSKLCCDTLGHGDRFVQWFAAGVRVNESNVRQIAQIKVMPNSSELDNRVPYQVTLAAEPYLRIGKLPVTVLLDNVRSLYNVGAFFRTADAAAIEKLLLCGITGRPPRREIAKTALGSEATVAWDYAPAADIVLRELVARDYEIAAIETSVHAVDLFDWEPRFPVCLLFGNEIDGLQPALAQFAHTHVRIPMLGAKHSLNVATAGGVVLYELLRKYRRLSEQATSSRAGS